MRSVSTIVAACFLGFLVNGHANETTARDDATDQATKQEMCKLTICQYNLRVTLKQKNGSLYDKTFDVLPGVVQPFGLTIFAGQTVYIEADVEGNKPGNFRAVDSVSHPEKTLVLNLMQSDDGIMLLSVTNPFDRTLKFDMGMMPLDKDTLLKTSSCPVMARGSAVEVWTRPVLQVVLGNARFVESNGNRKICD